MITIAKGDQAVEMLDTWPKAAPGVSGNVAAAVASIIDEVRRGGDAAVKRIAQRVGDPTPTNTLLSESERKSAHSRVTEAARGVLQHAANNIDAFARAVVGSMTPTRVERDGFTVGTTLRPVHRVACYVPGGRYPLPSTALMTAVTARAAGVKDICILTPQPSPEVVFAASLAEVERIYVVGGAQAIAAAALGTETIPRVDMVVGPGNAYVTEAKRQLSGVVGIDLIAGPSELVVVADNSANPDWIALDLLAQAEHDPDARAWLVCDDKVLAARVCERVAAHAETLDLPDFLNQQSMAALVFDHLDTCFAACNELGPEHLEVHVRDLDAAREALHNYGALFLGGESAVAFGDYMAGPNHTLPTSRASRFQGGLNPTCFLRTQSWLQLGEGAQSLAEPTGQFADLEGLVAHAASARARGTK